ncbi:MAG: hypothetical protein EAZ39_07575 [Oscillatoriales cyanobacterium]|nr:MAG: hypothetical protein EAZ49_06025 [Oscillatoriales cyanobacterium]TAF95339.1 MAG: hypothetical protein EAZ45_25825 [Oscillatoriales cyanobacterium]TAG20195.1 MAG: hypothetical protein EAZ39_07575 [Oscillatoriales cyanobacterium]TAG33523.1 MAG: hypothetical protein EAZ33_29960 [Oscillatoriales cyanobacterium]TAG50556.1 MAG: hypothetical protein EAZ28_32645 [Oscillatoriales cyanobacterium]
MKYLQFSPAKQSLAGVLPLKIGSNDQDFQRWYPPRDLSVESIPNQKSKILSSPEFISGVASKI